MKKLILLALVSIIGISLSGIALGADEAKGAAMIKTGTVKKVDVAAKQVVVMVARELTFTVTDATQIVQGTTPKKLADIKVDAKVTVDYAKEGEKRVAKKIALEK